MWIPPPPTATAALPRPHYKPPETAACSRFDPPAAPRDELGAAFRSSAAMPAAPRVRGHDEAASGGQAALVVLYFPR